MINWFLTSTQARRRGLICRVEEKVWPSLQHHGSISEPVRDGLIFLLPFAREFSPGQRGKTCPLGPGKEEGELTNPMRAWASQCGTHNPPQDPDEILLTAVLIVCLSLA